jgi:hypothetical protein
MSRINLSRSPLQKLHQKYWQEKGSARCGIQIITNLVHKYNMGNGILSNLESIQARLLTQLKEDYLREKLKIRGDV